MEYDYGMIVEYYHIHDFKLLISGYKWYPTMREDF